MLRIIETFNHLPVSLEVDLATNFQPGQIASLKIKNNRKTFGICDGLYPFGIIDDIKTKVIRKVVISSDIVPASSFSIDDTKENLILTQKHSLELRYQNIIASSFISDVVGILNAKLGIFTLPPGTICNYKLNSSINNAVKFSYRYAYNVLYPQEENSTKGTNTATIWNKNMIAESDMFDLTQEYPKYATLYVENGLLTTRRNDLSQYVGVVLTDPASNSSALKFLFDPENNIKVAGNH